ncbi:MAG: metallophosphoesterase family protein [Cytophagaceae bacterium]
MKRIGLISDTHGFLDDKVFRHFEDCDEIWHAGDFGSMEISLKLSAFKPLKGVFGNIDDKPIQQVHPKELRFNTEGFDVYMTHIGGYPGHYNKEVRDLIKNNPPDIFICGHSHILRVITDKETNTICINPGAAGNHGFHKVKTLIKMDLNNRKIENMKAIELGFRAK